MFPVFDYLCCKSDIYACVIINYNLMKLILNSFPNDENFVLEVGRPIIC